MQCFHQKRLKSDLFAKNDFTKSIDNLEPMTPSSFYVVLESQPTASSATGLSGQSRLWKLRPNDIACSQDSIGKKFKDGQSLEETLSQLRSGQCKVDDIERIQISWQSHDPKSPGQPRWWTYTGNRRLSLFQRLEDEGCLEFIVAQWVNTPVPEWRMTTKKPGDRPYIRK